MLGTTQLLLGYLATRGHDYPYNVQLLERFGFDDNDISTSLGISVSQAQLGRANKRVQPTADAAKTTDATHSGG